tara:strand:+ start:4215 stop:5156 length:942 start_codon:yes stop_codon:yes gene_type:complete
MIAKRMCPGWLQKNRIASSANKVILLFMISASAVGLVGAGTWFGMFSVAVNAQDAAASNLVIEKLQKDRPAMGTFSRRNRPGLDYVVIDAQYGTFDIEAIRQALSEMRPANGESAVTPIIRIPYDSRTNPTVVVDQVLDLGAFGVMFPNIETKEDAMTAVGAMRFVRPVGDDQFTPAGSRNSSSGAAVSYWGVNAQEYQAYADVWPLAPEGQLIAMLQIESVAGIEQLNNILDVPGIGAIFLGPTDLAASIGEDGPNSPRVEELVQEVLQVCLMRNVPCGYPIVASTSVDAERETARRLQEGFRVLAVMTTER